MIGNPKYKKGSYVSFILHDEIKYGRIFIVDAYGTFDHEEEPSYDIMSTLDGKPCLFKHIWESMVKDIIVETVLCYLEQDDCYLMLLRNKREQDMNKGKWLGVGGHVEALESSKDALYREVFEETGLTLLEDNYHGDVYFINDDYQEVMHLYTSKSFSGSIKECDEGTLEWVPKELVMELELWEGDRLFLPMLMDNKKEISLYLYYVNGKLVRSEGV